MVNSLRFPRGSFDPGQPPYHQVAALLCILPAADQWVSRASGGHGVELGAGCSLGEGEEVSGFPSLLRVT